MKKQNVCIAKEIDLTDYRELTEAELILVNGGREVENSNAGVANAQVGDTVTRNDNTTVTITQGDIDWAQAHCEGGDNSNNGGTGAGDMEAAPNSPSPSAPSSNPSAYGAQSQPGNGSGAPTGMPSYSAWGSDGSTQEMTASGVENPLGQNSGSIGYQPQGSQGDGCISGYSGNGTPSFSSKVTSSYEFTDFFHPESNGNFEVDYTNKVITADIHNNDSINDAYNTYEFWGGKGYAFQLKDGADVVHTFSGTDAAREYVRNINGYYNQNKTSKDTFSLGIGGKLALILGIGLEGGVIRDKSNNYYGYLLGSIGCGIQTPAVTKTDISVKEYLLKAKGIQTSFSFEPSDVGCTTSTTADICLGINGTYDLNNLNSSGFPNSWSFGSVGGGIWKTGTVVFPIHVNKKD